mgnify:FL=1
MSRGLGDVYKRQIKGVEDGTNYVSFGAFYATPTKENATPADIDTLYWWKKHSKTPASAIGGINHNNIHEILKAKPDYICVVRAVWNYKHGPKQAVYDFNKLISKIY